MKEKLVSWNKVVQKCDDIGKQHEKISQQTADARIFFFNSFGPVPEKIGEEAEGFVTGLLHQSLEVRC